MSEYNDTIEQWSSAIRDGGNLPGRAEVYRELVHTAISSLLQTNLPRTHVFMGEQEWNTSVEHFMLARTQHSPYFVDLAAEFAGGLPSEGPIADLAHFEALCLEVETTRDEDTRRYAAYGYNVLSEALPAEITFVQIWRDETDYSAQYAPISASEYVQLAETVI